MQSWTGQILISLQVLPEAVLFELSSRTDKRKKYIAAGDGKEN